VSTSLINQNNLIETHRGLVSYYIKGYKHTPSVYAQLLCEGLYGLCKAAKKFDTSLGHKFSTLAGWEIKGALSEYLRKEKRRNKFISTATDVYPQNEPHFYDVIDSNSLEISEDLKQQEIKAFIASCLSEFILQLPKTQQSIVTHIMYGHPKDKNDLIKRLRLTDNGYKWRTVRLKKQLRKMFAVKGVVETNLHEYLIF